MHIFFTSAYYKPRHASQQHLPGSYNHIHHIMERKLIMKRGLRHVQSDNRKPKNQRESCSYTSNYKTVRPFKCRPSMTIRKRN